MRSVQRRRVRAHSFLARSAIWSCANGSIHVCCCAGNTDDRIPGAFARNNGGDSGWPSADSAVSQLGLRNQARAPGLNGSQDLPGEHLRTSPTP